MLYWISKQITRLPAFRWMELPISVTDFAIQLSRQIDLTKEAKVYP
jgi:predicted unusual protein kinase regulating ubiquinone biosynthesis (AarF/ABC1/UbiB family)